MPTSFFLIRGHGNNRGGRPSLRCPKCRQVGVFEHFENVSDLMSQEKEPKWFCSRRCPNDNCLTHVFFVLDQRLNVIRSYPAERIDFDATNVPTRISATLEEAISCSSEGAFVAAAIMIRRTLEELCEDKSAKGSNLKERIAALRSNVVLPAELFVAMDELRLLGNDAAHIEAKVYDSIGKEEVDLGLLLTKEILKAVYQLDELVKRLQALKK
jgi:Domain of unknown function (DUF4145)